MPTPSAGPRESAARELLITLIGFKSWVRDSQQSAYDGWPPAALMVLGILTRTGPARVSRLADEARVDVSVMSRQVSYLERHDLVRRQDDPDDGRAHLLSLTAEGADVLERGRTRLAAAIAERLESWEPAEIVAIASDLRRLLTDLTVEPAGTRSTESSATTAARRTAPAHV